MSYATLEKMYSSLSLERQKEAFDFICYLFEKNEKSATTPKAVITPKDTYPEGFFDLFGSCTDESFVEPKDFVIEAKEDELF